MHLPVNTRNGILSVLASIVYLLFFGIFFIHTYLMITVCTKVELKFEIEVEKKKADLNQLNLLDPEAWKAVLFLLKSKKINDFLQNMVEFYEPIAEEEKERVFLAKHQTIFAE